MTRLSLNQLIDLKVLLSVERLGPTKIRSLIAKFKSFENILNADFNSLLKIDGISTNLAKRIQKANKHRELIHDKTKKEFDTLNKIGGRFISVWDKEYPALLKNIYDPPLLLYLKGNFSDSDNYPIAIVGTRQPTNYGKIQAERIASELSSQNITIVSGLARGIDSIAHKSALKSEGRTIAVIGSGLNVVYPPENKKLFEEIAEKGVVLTEFEIGSKPDAVNFPKRNRIISGLSLGVVVVETGVAGGAMQTASLALDQNREVFAVPGNLGVKQSEGTNLLIQKGEAKLLRTTEDILIELELKLKPVLGKNIPKQQIDLNLFEEKILNALKSEPIQIDKIASATNLSTSDCLVHLLSLEFKGLVKQLPGKVFVTV